MGLIPYRGGISLRKSTSSLYKLSHPGSLPDIGAVDTNSDGSTLSGFTDIPGSLITAIGLKETLNITRGVQGDFIRARRD